MVNRRGLLRLSASAAGLAAFTAGCGILRLGTRRPWQLGVLAPDDGTGPRWDAFRAGLRDLGWIEGQNLITTWRLARGSTDSLDPMAADLVAFRVDVLVTGGTEAAVAAQAATHTIPIVVASVNDPIGTGLIASYSHPGGNVTGSALLSPQLTPKWMELLSQLSPGLRQLALLVNGDNPSTSMLIEQMHSVAPATVQLRAFDVRNPAGLLTAFDQATDWEAQALLVLPDYQFYIAREQLAQMAVSHRLPTLYPSREYTAAGGLLSYGPDQADLYHRAAGFVDRILNGAHPADLPVEQPSTFELVANMTASQQIGLTFPNAILLQASVIR